MDGVRGDPLTPEQQAELALHREVRRQSDREYSERAEHARRAVDAARARRAGLGPSATWGPILREAGLPARTALEAQALGRPSGGIVLGHGAAGGITSRLGGAPDVPAGFSWPTYRDVPLAFLAQLRLSELPALVRADLYLPPDGVLAFFFETKDSPWGFEPTDRGGGRVFLFRDPSTLHAAKLPADRDAEVMGEQSIGFVDELSLPSLESPAGTTLRLEGSDAVAYREAQDAELTARGNVNHKVGGYADEIQGAMEVECAGVARGLSFGGRVEMSQSLLAEARKWRLLLQLDTDYERGLEWGDGGRLFFWLDEDNLRLGAFNHAWCILQCY